MEKPRYLFLVNLLVLILFISPIQARAGGKPKTPPPQRTPKPTPITPLPTGAFKDAILIDSINNRPVLVPPGGTQLYRLRGSDIYLEISGENLIQAPLESILAGGSVTYTQECGVNVIMYGLGFAKLRNRVNVTYFSGYTLAPARFNWMDMRGTKTTSIFAKWKGLGQFSYPALRKSFKVYGYTQAYGNLEINFYPFGALTNYYVSRLVVTRSGTYCQ
jgi:hypothetical protein